MQCDFNDCPQAGFMDMDVATVQSFDDMWIDIHADDLKSMRGKGGGGWQVQYIPAQEHRFFESSLMLLAPECLQVNGVKYSRLIIQLR